METKFPVLTNKFSIKYINFTKEGNVSVDTFRKMYKRYLLGAMTEESHWVSNVFFSFYIYCSTFES